MNHITDHLYYTCCKTSIMLQRFCPIYTKLRIAHVHIAPKISLDKVNVLAANSTHHQRVPAGIMNIHI